jgi:hypothetical protein
MKLQDLMPQKKGTYVGLRVLEPSCAAIKAHCKAAGIPITKSSLERRLHTTVLYSKKPCPNFVAEPETVHNASFITFELFTSRSGENVLVMKLNAPSVYARHIELMAQHQAVYDFPVFTPHITISDDFSGDVYSIPPINFPITLGAEYSEELSK